MSLRVRTVHLSLLEKTMEWALMIRGRKRHNSGGHGASVPAEANRFSRYNGRKTDPPLKFSPEMEEACRYVEEVVNREVRQRMRFPLEWAGTPNSDVLWRANVAASNCYEGAQESVGFHSDQMTYLGPYCTIGTYTSF